VAEQSPWSTLWLDPKGTIRHILETGPHKHYPMLIALGGVAQTFSVAATMGLGDKMSFMEIVIVSLLMGPISGWLTILIRGWLLTWVGGWLGGAAIRAQTRVSLAWSWAPMVYFSPLWGVKYILFKNETFMLHRPVLESIPVLKGMFGFIEFVDFAVYVWSLVVLIQMLAEINRFTSMRALMNVVLSSLLIGIPVLLLLYIMAPALN